MRIHKAADAPFLRLVAALLFLALGAWTGAALYPLLSPRPAFAAAEAPPESGVPLQGIALRRERQLCGRRCQIAAEQGARVPCGAVLAAEFDGTPIFAPRSSMFYSDWDGLEYLDPDAVSSPDPESVRTLLESEAEETPGVFGRLVFGSDWYLAALVPEQAELPAAGSHCLLRFEELRRTAPARLLWISDSSGGCRALVLRLTEGDAPFLSLRKCKALLLPRQEEAIMIQKEG